MAHGRWPACLGRRPSVWQPTRGKSCAQAGYDSSPSRARGRLSATAYSSCGRQSCSSASPHSPAAAAAGFDAEERRRGAGCGGA